MVAEKAQGPGAQASLGSLVALVVLAELVAVETEQRGSRGTAEEKTSGHDLPLDLTLEVGVQLIVAIAPEIEGPDATLRESGETIQDLAPSGHARLLVADPGIEEISEHDQDSVIGERGQQAIQRGQLVGLLRTEVQIRDEGDGLLPQPEHVDERAEDSLTGRA